MASLAASMKAYSGNLSPADQAKDTNHDGILEPAEALQASAVAAAAPTAPGTGLLLDVSA